MTEELTTTASAELAPSGDAFLAMIAAAARDPEVDPAKMAALFDLKDRIDARQAKTEYIQAFSRLMLKMPRVQKNGTIDMGTKGKMSFAKWEDVDRIIRPLLAEEGFSLSFSCNPTPGAVQMTGHLRHAAGHEETSTMQLPPDAGAGRNALQAIGSSHQYGKRYIACDMLNIITVGADDDGNGAGAVTEQEALNLTNMVNALEMNAARTTKFLAYAGAETIETIQRYRYKDLMAHLARDLRKKQEGQ